ILFVNNTTDSVAASSIITIFNKLGIDVNRKELNYYRELFVAQRLSPYIDRLFEITKINCMVMTNDSLDENERTVWEKGYVKDIRFKAVLRLDKILNSWDEASFYLNNFGYKVSNDLSDSTINEIKRFLGEWIEKMEALYCAVSLPA